MYKFTTISEKISVVISNLKKQFRTEQIKKYADLSRVKTKSQSRTIKFDRKITIKYIK
jgi:hypothetical protein